MITGELDNAVLRDRTLLSRDGVAVVTVVVDAENGKLAERPRIVTRGLADSGAERKLIERGREVVSAALDHGRRRLGERDFADARVRDSLSRFFYEQIHRRPVIIPVVVEVGGKNPDVKSQ
jgi:ribonuclease J